MHRFLSIVATAALAFLPVAATAHHAPSHRVVAPDAPESDASLETAGGTLESLTVRDLRNGASVRYFSLRQADGSRLAVRGLAAADAAAGAYVRVEGRRNGDTLFVERSATLRAPEPAFSDVPSGTQRHTGTLEFLHADDFDRGSCDLVYTLKDADGGHVQVRFPVAPEILERGMSLAVDAVPTADGIISVGASTERHRA